jgi:hypothetical protein
MRFARFESHQTKMAMGFIAIKSRTALTLPATTRAPLTTRF